MNFTDYQEQASRTVAYPRVGDNYVFPTLGLAGEAGEIANKVKKIERDHAGVVTEEVRASIAGELGDLLWYVAALCTELRLDLDEVASENLRKLSIRAENGLLGGSGDTR